MIKIKKMPSKEMLERFLEGSHDYTKSSDERVVVYFDNEKGEFVETRQANSFKLLPMKS